MHRPLCAIAVASLLLACPHVDFGPQGEVRDPGALLQSVDAAQGRISSLQAQGSLSLSSPEGSGTLSVFVVAQKPDKLHVESFDFFNRPIAALTTDGTRFGLYDASQNQFIHGPASPKNLARFTRAELGPEDVVGLVLGGFPRDPNAEPSLSVNARAGAYALTLTSATRPQRLLVDPITRRLREVETPELHAVFDDFLHSGQTAFPKRIHTEVPASKLELELRYTELTLNSPPEAEAFSVEPPPDVPAIEVDAEGNAVQPERQPPQP